MDTNSFELAAFCLAKEAYSGQSNGSCSYVRQFQAKPVLLAKLFLPGNDHSAQMPSKAGSGPAVSSSHKRGTDDISSGITDEESKQRNAGKLMSLYQPQKFTDEPQQGAQHQTNHATTHPKPQRGFAALIKDQKQQEEQKEEGEGAKIRGPKAEQRFPAQQRGLRARG